MSGGRGAGAKGQDSRRLTDRRLGSEWAGWDGDEANHPPDFSTPPARFWRASAIFSFAWLLTSLALASFVASWFFAYDWLPKLLLAAGLALGAPPALSLVLVRRSLRAGRPVAPLARPALGLQLCVLRALTYLLKLHGGQKAFGVSRDELVNSYLQIHNAFTRLGAEGRERAAGPVLVLAPRCIAPDTMKALKAEAEAAGAKFTVAGTGAKARAAVAELQPRAIVAVACERDLLTGIRDTARRDLPILALCISLPLGPCKGAQLERTRLTEALEWVNDRD